MINIILNRAVPIGLQRRCLQLIICWLIFSPLCGWAELLVGPEYEVKTGFIFNFANFVNWPEKAFETSEESLSFCFISDHPAANVLFTLNEQPIRERILTVEKVESDLTDQNCQILFLGTDNTSFIRRTLAILRGQHVLTIGEIEGFAQMGGVINFYNQDNKLRFEVNIDAANRAELKLGAQILQSAQRIIKETEEDRQTQQEAVEKLQEELNPTEPQTEPTETAQDTEPTEPIDPSNSDNQQNSNRETDSTFQSDETAQQSDGDDATAPSDPDAPIDMAPEAPPGDADPGELQGDGTPGTPPGGSEREQRPEDHGSKNQSGADALDRKVEQ